MFPYPLRQLGSLKQVQIREDDVDHNFIEDYHGLSRVGSFKHLKSSPSKVGPESQSRENVILNN